MTNTIVSSLLLSFAFSAHAALPEAAPMLPGGEGKIVRVRNSDELYGAVDALKSDTTIMLDKGNYLLSKPIQIPAGLSKIAIRGATGNYDEVVIKGAGMNNKAVWHGIMLNGSEDILIADMTIGWVGFHPVAIDPKAQGVHIYHCRLVDAGEQFIKASSDKKGGGSNHGKVEYCLIEYTHQGPPNGYTNGVDVHGGHDWEIRHNLFRNIRTPETAQYKNVPSVLMWNGAKNSVCESNTFLNCDRAIAFGLTGRKDFPDHEGGLIQNNFIYVGKNEVKHTDAGIFVASPNTRILHNTIFLNQAYPNAIEVRFPSTKGVEAAYNLSDAKIVARDNAQVKETGNATNAAERIFKDPEAGDLHIKGKGNLPVMDKVITENDWDGQERKAGRSVAGADQP